MGFPIISYEALKNNLPPELRWEIFLYDLLWIAPIVAGVICVGVALHALKKRHPITTVMLCFLMAVGEMGIGVFGAWKGGRAIYEVIGVAGDISVELMYEGWKHSWLPIIVAGITTGLLLLIALKEWSSWYSQPISK